MSAPRLAGFEPSLLQPGRNCWRIARAGRAAALVDAAAYFSALRETLRRARERVLIVGWDIHAFMRLDPDAPESLRDVLFDLATANPALDVRILLWDFTVLYSADRLPFPKAVLDWSMPANVKLALDNRLPMGASHHEKVVAVDDRVAFIGGIDLTEGRWDTPAHAADDSRRVLANGERYGPFHDVQLVVDGEAAAALGELCRARWVSCVRVPLDSTADVSSDPWPESVEPAWSDVDVGLSRTRAAYDGTEDVREVRDLYVDTIASARHYVYIENQYLTADRICDALGARLAEEEGPEIVLVTRAASRSWLEQNTMGIRRRQFVARLRAADTYGRLRVLAPRVPGVAADELKVHAKVMIADDRWVRIGSANLNNRSMGLDSECDALIDCRRERDRGAAAALRNRLLAEHLGTDESEVARAMREHGSIVATITELRGKDRSLVELDEPSSVGDADDLLPELADLEAPLTPPELLDRLVPVARTVPPEQSTKAIVQVALGVTAIVGVALAWRFTGLRELVDPDVASAWLGAVPDGGLGLLAALGIFVGAGLIAFPVTVLIFASALTFGPWLGFTYAVLGTYASAAATFAVGRAVGRRPLERWASRAVASVGKRLARRGVLAIAVLRIVPLAPFTVVNLLAGASPVRWSDYALGTVLGMTPGILILTLMGGQLGRFLREPSVGRFVLLAVLGLGWVGVGVVLHRIAAKLERRGIGGQGR